MTGTSFAKLSSEPEATGADGLMDPDRCWTAQSLQQAVDKRDAGTVSFGTTLARQGGLGLRGVAACLPLVILRMHGRSTSELH
jgi:hypothetical protein